MIRYADSPALEQALMQILAGEDLLHGCLLSTYKNARAPGAEFWVCESGRIPYGALLRINGEFIFCCGENPDFTELTEFLRFMDCRCLCARLPVVEKLASPLSLCAPEHAPIMVKRNRKNPHLQPVLKDGEERIAVCRETENLRPVYELIIGHYEGFDNYGGGPGYDSWLSGMRLRERDGICGVWCLYADGQLVSTASVVSASGRCADIGAVVTRRERRGRGYAARLIGSLSEELERGGRFPLLCCANDTLEGYYRRLGFAAYDRWAAAERSRTV